MRRLIVGIIVLAAATGFGWAVYQRLEEKRRETPGGGGAEHAAPVEVAPIERGEITERRTFSGTLRATAQFMVAPKISGRVERLDVDLADPIERGQVIAVLDSEEYVQSVAQAAADLAVARANLAEAESALEIAERALRRVEQLRESGIASDSQLDAATADHLAKQAQLEVAKAQVTREEAAVETARIRLGYTNVAAGWTGGDDWRVVAERFVDEGDMVSENIPIVSIVELDPITGEIFVTEKDYARLKTGHSAALVTDAYPGEQFEGRIERISPVFRQNSRQARVELTIDNPEQRLKPGMFIRATVVLETAENAAIVPESAITKRNDQQGVFVVDEQTSTVSWRPVTPGIREGDRVQVFGDGLTGRVVTLGQQLVDDGSAITIPGDENGDVKSPDDGADST